MRNLRNFVAISTDAITMSAASDRWRQRCARWLNRHSPAAQAVTLDYRKLFILPTRAGLGFLLIVGLLWILGTNYINNLIFALTFLLVSLFAIALLHSFANLCGIQVQFIEARPVFAGGLAEVQLSLERGNGRGRAGIQLYWPGEPTQAAQEGALLDLLDTHSTLVRVVRLVTQRGRLRASRLKIESRFPLGLFCCWSWVDLDIEFLVYPQPKSAGPLPVATSTGEGELNPSVHHGEDFMGLKPYRAGDALRHVAWKQYAGGRGLYSKDYASGLDARLWLDWNLLAGRDVETRLSNLCAWALQAESEQLAYGLQLPGSRIEPELGSRHLHRVLSALALFPIREGG